MPHTITTSEQQRWFAAYSTAVREYYLAHPAPAPDDLPCRDCRMPAGRRCSAARRVPGRSATARCPVRAAAYLDAVAAHKLAAQAYGQRAADEVT